MDYGVRVPCAHLSDQQSCGTSVGGAGIADHSRASYFNTLSEQARKPPAFNERLTKAEASKEIDR